MSDTSREPTVHDVKGMLVVASDARLRDSGFAHLTIASPSLNGRGDVTLYVPPKAQNATDLPAIVLLHGIYASHWAWTELANAHTTLEGLIADEGLPPFALIMPSDGLWGQGSGYIKHPDADFEKWIADEVSASAMASLSQLGDQSVFYIAGMSMGGLGALRIGAKRSDRFKAFSAMSSVTDVRQMAEAVARKDVFEDWPKADASVLDVLVELKGTYGPFRFDCGRDDIFIDTNRKLHEGLVAQWIEHGYEEFDGGHEWGYWADNLPATLRFFGALEGTVAPD